MRTAITLTVTTPLAVAVSDTAVRSIRAEDASGGFGLLPGHADFLTVLGASVLRWRGAGSDWHYCALRGGVLQMRGGTTVDVACREAVPGRDLASLEVLVQQAIEDELDAARQARAEQTRLHTTAIRSLIRHLGTAAPGSDLAGNFR
ncbi:ATP synthase F0F1 subunit epsilon [Salipiger aestuarii]|uniref:ATP synthase epsilon chain n=1 Tax=Salipiger aestuarii TaxID=568098 RepID=A0A327Y9L2_9RHOB|nr:F0F1 ATP synthase subunit epsilon [Salipiger aestuarii]EIE48996.1 F0F1 ATP synthase subunit epsilon [Citreicella sp. 357]KAA8605289.1 ATP synthase F0F1 subunit epsilon [Salipiger aestuarii]KAA8607517.1 ATP synthase F0F1 subunit epsilon [Salipiger aestuarii]KAB2536941.1 ATP synthase F0F1 subunit epsilon [Salipiger aestuarii]RAK15169.1 F-type H+-transporting ATPase subunit epsilon [Salipiger aestuarii]